MVKSPNSKTNELLKKPMSNENVKHTLSIPYYCLRNISSPEDKAENREVYSGHVPAESILELPLDGNVRTFIPDAVGRARSTYSMIHKEIKQCLENEPQNFCVLNSGVTIVARKAVHDNENKKLKLFDASIVNGAQTQGCIKNHFEERGTLEGISVKYELIVTTEENLISSICIARNRQNVVKNISIVGRRGVLNELESYFRKTHPKLLLQKSETELPGGDDSVYVSTERLLQCLACVVPESLWFRPGERNPVYAYSSRATCLKEFEMVQDRATDKNDPDNEKFQNVYHFWLDVVGQVYELYEHWKHNPLWESIGGLKPIIRDEEKIIEAPDGLVFPVLSALSHFAEKRQGSWRLKIPDIDAELVSAIMTAFKEIAKNKPEICGKSKPVYSAVESVSHLYKRFKTQ